MGARPREHDAETAPLAHTEHYQLDIDTTAVAELWRRGSVIGSWRLDLTAAALSRDPSLEEFQGRVSDSGEGRWTVLAAVDEGVPTHVLTAALYERFSSRGNADFAAKLLSAMRKQFGGAGRSRGGLVVFGLKEGVTRDQLLDTVGAVSDWARAQPGPRIRPPHPSLDNGTAT